MKTRTSNNTLAGVDILDKAECMSILTKIPVKHKTEIESLTELYKCQFLQWYIELMSGFNLLFYGYGSKKKLLEEFSEAYLRDRPLLVINGFLSKLKIKEVFLQVINGVDMGVKPGSRETLEELTELIREYFADSDRKVQNLYIMIHNIDGQGLRTLQIQNCLSILASSPNIYFIASTDHINSTLLFDQDRATNSSVIPYDGIYEEACDKLYSEPYDEFYDKPYGKPHDKPYNKLYNDNATQKPTNIISSDEFGDNELLISIETNTTNKRKKFKNKKVLIVLIAVCDHCGNGLKIHKDRLTLSFRNHLIHLYKNKVLELKESNKPNTELPQNTIDQGHESFDFKKFIDFIK
ncbi:origin recognition complex subunit 2-domain-containing protein [Gigaspora rosea]|uniref:Origin recognition complex subunit 2 n=1 Tax=Gigaspora rosea TaxID=44941 RepID=A0A397W6E4_9GLOM|nr:origin recognition complex subunit 2-domain-containing protein [Gigaspora rosea]